MDSREKGMRSNRNFKRLYWMSNKLQILKILSRVNIKYLFGLKRNFSKTLHGGKGTRYYLRYDGCEFQVSLKTVQDEINRRYKNENNIS